MNKVFEAFHLDDPASLKRVIAAALAGVTVLGLNPLLAKWGLPPVSDTSLELFAGVAATYLLQSGINSAAAKKAEAAALAAKAAAAVTDVDAANKALEVKP